MRARARIARGLALALSASAQAGCVTSPKAEALRQQQMLELGDAVNELRVTTAEFRAVLDSLRTVAAKQDTTLSRLANVTGVVVVK